MNINVKQIKIFFVLHKIISIVPDENMPKSLHRKRSRADAKIKNKKDQAREETEKLNQIIRARIEKAMQEPSFKEGLTQEDLGAIYYQLFQHYQPLVMVEYIARKNK